MMTAQNSGIWNNKFRATALPSTSARSQAPMATSPISQLGQRVQRGYHSRQHWARSFPVTTPKRRRDHLHEHGHQAGQTDHPQEPVLELGAALQVGAPVAGVHVADAHQQRRPDERPNLSPKAGFMAGHGDCAVYPFQRHMVDGISLGPAAG